MSSKSHTQTASPPAASRRLRILTRWRSASALNTRSSSSASSSLSCGAASGAQHWITGSGVVTLEIVSKKLDPLLGLVYGRRRIETFRSVEVHVMNHANPLPVAVIGAGPVGLA